MKNTLLLCMVMVFGVMFVIGIFRMPYLYRISIFGLGALCGINALRVFRGRGVKWHGFRYTRARYYLMMLVLLLPCIITRPPRVFWIEFVAFGGFGMIGESLWGLYWEQAFGERLYIYQKDTIFRGQSSWLNFIPWGLGGSLYHSLTIKAFYAPKAGELLIFWALYLLCFCAVSVRRHKKNLHPSARLLKRHGYVSVFWPVLGSLVMASLVSGQYQMMMAALVYAVGGWVIEYFWGRILTLMLTDQFWVYLPDAMDNGHLTAWSLLPFMLGGFWLVSLSHIFTYF